jgi:hypothetical protein
MHYLLLTIHKQHALVWCFLFIIVLVEIEQKMIVHAEKKEMNKPRITFCFCLVFTSFSNSIKSQKDVSREAPNVFTSDRVLFGHLFCIFLLIVACWMAFSNTVSRINQQYISTSLFRL